MTTTTTTTTTTMATPTRRRQPQKQPQNQAMSPYPNSITINSFEKASEEDRDDDEKKSDGGEKKRASAVIDKSMFFDTTKDKSLVALSLELQKVVSIHDKSKKEFEEILRHYETQVQSLRIATVTLQTSNEHVEQLQQQQRQAATISSRSALPFMIRQNEGYQDQMEQASRHVLTTERKLVQITDELCKLVVHKSIYQSRLSNEVRSRTRARNRKKNEAVRKSGSTPSRKNSRASDGGVKKQQAVEEPPKDTIMLFWDLSSTAYHEGEHFTDLSLISESLRRVVSEDDEQTLEHLTDLLEQRKPDLPELNLRMHAAAAAVDDKINGKSKTKSSKARTGHRPIRLEIQTAVDKDQPKLIRDAYYSGPLVDDQLHGIGSLWFKNGDFYLGEFVRGEMHGLGTFTRKIFSGRSIDIPYASGHTNVSSELAVDVFRGSFVHNRFVKPNITVVTDYDSMGS